jgi:hypothetical protein
MPISGVDPTPRPTAVYASNAALPRRPQDSLPSCLLGFGRTRLALASSHQLLLSHPASGFPTGFTARHTAARRVRCVLPKQWAMADAPSSTDRPPSSPRGKASSEASGYSGGVPGSSPITDPRLRPKRTRSKGPFLRRRYPASSVVWPSPTPVRPAACATWGLPAPVETGLPR